MALSSHSELGMRVMLRKRTEHIHELLTELYQKQQGDNISVVRWKQRLAGRTGGSWAKLCALTHPYRQNLKGNVVFLFVFFTMNLLLSSMFLHVLLLLLFISNEHTNFSYGSENSPWSGLILHKRLDGSQKTPMMWISPQLFIYSFSEKEWGYCVLVIDQIINGFAFYSRTHKVDEFPFNSE